MKPRTFLASIKDFCGWMPSFLFQLGFKTWHETNIGTIFYRRDENKKGFSEADQACKDANTKFKDRLFEMCQFY